MISVNKNLSKAFATTKKQMRFSLNPIIVYIIMRRDK